MNVINVRFPLFSSILPAIILAIPFLVLILPAIILAVREKLSSKTRNPPGPWALPLIGNFLQLKTPLHEYFGQLSVKHGPLIYLKFGSRRVLVANSSRMAEEILKTQDLLFCSRPSLLAARKLAYNNLDITFAPYSEYWREMRKMCVMNLLSVKRVQSFRPIREDEVSKMIDTISNHASSLEPVDLTQVFMLLTNNMISRVEFGKSFERDSNERKEFVNLVAEFQRVLACFYCTDYFPWIGWIDKLIGKVSQLEEVYQKWDMFYQQLIDEHLDSNRPKSMDGDILDVLLKLRAEESEIGRRLTIDHIKAILMDVYFGSTDTAATTLTWAMTALINNPMVMNKVQAEIRETLFPQVMNGIVKEEDIREVKLPYFDAVIKETFRKYTPIPLLAPREAIKKCTIDGYEIPEKTLVFVNAWAIAHDPHVWANPNEFMPERFLVDTETESIASYFKSGTDFDLIPFGSGRRGCPGISMGLTTLQIALVNLLYLFDWKLPNGLNCDDETLDSFLMHKKNPLCLIAKKFVV